jgi:hypothetical protein
MRPLLLMNGVTFPEKMSREEFAKFFAVMRQRFPQRRGGNNQDANKPGAAAKDATKSPATDKKP